MYDCHMFGHPLDDEDRIVRILLRQIRQEAGLRQADVAKKLGRTQSFVSDYENKPRCRLTVAVVRHICEAVGISIVEFVRRYEAFPRPEAQRCATVKPKRIRSPTLRRS
jgi:transcriptional regulator with XRE-family HTH domain